MPSEPMTGLTGSRLSAPRATANPGRPVRPVIVTGSDGSDGSIAHTRAHTERKAVNPSDPSLSRQAVLAAERGTRRANAGLYHLLASQPVQLGYVLCGIGEPLCGT